MSVASQNRPLSDKALHELSQLADQSVRAEYIAAHPRLHHDAVVKQLNDVVRSRLRENAREALHLAEASVAIARRLGNQESFGRSLRSKANALYMMGDNQSALDFHAEALQVFRNIGNAQEEARTLIPSIQPNILLGKYDRAFEAAETAKKIFRELGDEQRLGHVEINVGNIYHRQDRFEEGLACYERAYETLIPFRDSEGLAVALYNMAVCLITLNDFPRALATYQRARVMCVDNGMTLLVSQSDYNIAYLYYLRGEYSRAIEMLRATRLECEKNGDAHILALCYLDLSEIYLELNLSTEAKETAHEGYLKFQKLGMGYEEAKCQANEATALSQLGKALLALELFAQARAKFVTENNLVWPSLIDLYRAVVLFNEGRLFEAKRFCLAAAQFFETSVLPGKAILCHLLLSRLSLRTSEVPAAQAECARAIQRLSKIESPALSYQAHFLMGQIQESSGNGAGAYESFQKARESLETLRGSLRGEELKIAFMKNRLEVYESLVDLCLSGKERRPAHEAFGYIELAKSRSLAELLIRSGPAIPAGVSGQSQLVRRIRDMREELNWYYRRIELEQLSAEDPSPERIGKLQQQALAHENELLHVLRELPHNGGVAHQAPVTCSIDQVRASLPPEAALIEYFVVKEQFVAAVLTDSNLEIVPVTPVSRVVNLLRMFQFQISKFRLGAEYVRTFSKPMLQGANSHLRQLCDELIAPLRPHLVVNHLVIVPHGILHYAPFHAMHDGSRYLIDEFTISYAPSASVFEHCQQKPSSADGPPLILGVPDSRAPFIEDEVRSIAEIVPSAELLLGLDANENALREKGAASRLIHVATHGRFRQDNPMFSGIKLGDAYLSLYDMYHLKLNADLVALSGCATGMNVVTAGDELLGLVRGLMYAGARSVLLSLWDVHDRTTAELMAAFYQRLCSGDQNVAALQAAMIEVREKHPHPYYWAPFTLTGKVSVVSPS